MEPSFVSDPAVAGFALRGVAVTRGGRTVLDGIDCTFGGSGVIGLIGPNGAGKTTLLRAMMGFLPLFEGAVAFDGQDLSLWERSSLACRVGYMAQGAPCFWPTTLLLRLVRIINYKSWIPCGSPPRRAAPWWWWCTT